MNKINNNIQIKNNKLAHLLGLESLPKEQIINILDRADNLIDVHGKLKKTTALHNKSIANLFFEPSTRTRNTFEIAAKRSGAQVVNIDLANSALKKNEALMDTMHTLKAMQIDMFVVRHKQNFLPHQIAQDLSGVAILNAGDGTNAHPTQALLDMLSIRRHKHGFEDLSVAIVGDIVNSRVAHSNICALKTLGTKDIRLIAPSALQYNAKECKSFQSFEQGIEGVDVVMMLRLQKERMVMADIPSEQEYFYQFGLTKKRAALAKKEVIIMHPGPINRGVEIASDMANDKRSIILEQVRNGIALRMAVMEILAENYE